MEVNPPKYFSAVTLDDLNIYLSCHLLSIVIMNSGMPPSIVVCGDFKQSCPMTDSLSKRVFLKMAKN